MTKLFSVPRAATALLAAVLAVPALAGAAAAAEPAAPAAPAAPAQVNKGYSIPVGAITDLGALPVLGGLGYDLTGLLGS